MLLKSFIKTLKYLIITLCYSKFTIAFFYFLQSRQQSLSCAAAICGQGIDNIAAQTPEKLRLFPNCILFTSATQKTKAFLLPSFSLALEKKSGPKKATSIKR